MNLLNLLILVAAMIGLSWFTGVRAATLETMSFGKTVSAKSIDWMRRVTNLCAAIFALVVWCIFFGMYSEAAAASPGHGFFFNTVVFASPGVSAFVGGATFFEVAYRIVCWLFSK